ncbi:MAG TPA: hypothetical protein VKU41_15360 [Polyangiaceae bacterium]|nr:hypothetical protein [Polyangiaceae bacterium]
MMATRERLLIGATVAVWIAGLGTAAALGYELNRPIQSLVATSHLSASVGAAHASPAVPTLEQAPVLYVPTITIVGRMPHHGAQATAYPATAPEIEHTQCAPWRELDMGSGRVQVCE